MKYLFPITNLFHDILSIMFYLTGKSSWMLINIVKNHVRKHEFEKMRTFRKLKPPWDIII